MTEVIDGLDAGVLNWGDVKIQISPVGIPITYFEHTPSFSHLNGIIGITLAVTGVVPAADDKTRTVAGVVTFLKCNIPAAIALRDAINGALLLAQPVEKPEGPAN
jgi:hypothetical protein